MICRIWRGWTTPQNADAYESIVRNQVIPGIEAMRIEGFRHIDLLRRLSNPEVEFASIMWFDDLAAVRRFTGAQPGARLEVLWIFEAPTVAAGEFGHCLRQSGRLRGTEARGGSLHRTHNDRR